MPPTASGKQPAYIEPYSGWATTERGGFFYARVHQGQSPPLPEPGDDLEKKLDETFKTLHLNAIANAQVRLAGFPGAGPFTADGHGFLKVPLPPGMQAGSSDVSLQLEMGGYAATPASTTVQIWSAAASSRGIISDIDDTLTDTDVTHKFDLLKNTFFHNTYDVKVFPGAPQALSAIAGKSAGLPILPVFYLSGSPWALHPRISEAFDRVGLPHGATILRRYTQEPMNPYDFKHPHLLEIVDANPGRKWILCGDSGEKDPEVYRTLMDERPNAVEADEDVFIHNVTGEDASSDRLKGFTVFNQWDEVVAAIQQRKLALAA